jgi:hypothetical protein
MTEPSISESGLSEDFCKCGHVASRHRNGDGECVTCRTDGRLDWALMARCHRFNWAETWQAAEPVRRAS